LRILHSAAYAFAEEKIYDLLYCKENGRKMAGDRSRD
jgi:hypothetical protein